MAHSDVTKNDVTDTSKVFYLKVGIKASKTLKTAHRYVFCSRVKISVPPGTKVFHTFFVKVMSLSFFFSFFLAELVFW